MATAGRPECPVCFSNYDPYHHVPKVLGCGHTFCVICLETLCTDSKIICPQCKQFSDTPDNSANFPTNFVAIQGAEDLCVECKNTPGTKSCQCCKKNICEDCEYPHTLAHRATFETDLESLRQALAKVHTITLSKDTLQTINRINADTAGTKDHIKTLCDSYDKATDQLRSLLNNKADIIKQNNIHAYKTWQQQSFQDQGAVQAFIMRYDTDSTDADTLGIDSDTLNGMQFQCTTLLQQMETIETGLPVMTKCCLKIREDVGSDISSSAEIVRDGETATFSTEGDQVSAINPQPEAANESDSQCSTAMSQPSGSKYDGDQDASAMSRPDTIATKTTWTKAEEYPYVLELASVVGGKKGHRSSQSGTSGEYQETGQIPSSPSTLRPQYASARFVTEMGGKGTTAGKFQWPRGIACVSNGNVVVTDQGNNRYQAFTNHWTHIANFQFPGQSCGPTGAAVDRQGRLFICEFKNNRIRVIDEKGTRTFGSYGNANEDYDKPADIAIDQRGHLYVCDQGNDRVQVVTTEGKFIKTLTRVHSGRNKLRSKPVFVSTNQHNGVIVTDSDGHLYIFNETGRHLKNLNNDSIRRGSFIEAGGTATDPWGNILVADIVDGCVCVLDKTGRVQHRIGEQGRGVGQIGKPWDIALTSEGNILVCDLNNHKVLMYEIPKSATN